MGELQSGKIDKIGEDEVVLDFSKMVEREKELKEREKMGKKARKSGYVKRKRKELNKKHP